MELFKLIPDSIWSVFLGSFLTLLGVLLTNRHHGDIQKNQLEFEGRERERQRKFETRAEVYLSATAEMVKAQKVLGGLSTIDLSKENVGNLLSDFSSATGQALLIADDETAEAINEFVEVFFTSYFYLLTRVLPLQKAINERDIQNDVYNRYESEANRIIAIMTKVNEARDHSNVDWSVLDQNLSFAISKSQEAADRRGVAWDEIVRINLQFMDDALIESKKISHALLPALVAIRKELDIPSDISLYKKQLEKRLATADRVIDEFKAVLESGESV